jgi:SulP family sulfate permease
MNMQAPPSPGPDRLQSGQRPPQARSRSWLRLFQGIKPVTRTGTARDALAGFQLAAMNIPQALGYTKIAGMPIVTGFYTLLLPLLAFAVFGSSRYLVVAADSATASILAGKLATMAPLASARYVALASTVALLTAVFCCWPESSSSDSWPISYRKPCSQGFSPELDFRWVSRC